MFEKYMKVPIVMVDEMHETNKLKMGQILNSETSEDYDIIIGEGEYIFTDYEGVEDKWIPSKDSIEKALEGEFDACVVFWRNRVPCLIPWTKAKFKKELEKFSINYYKNLPDKVGERPILMLTLQKQQNEEQTNGTNEGASTPG